MATRLASLNPLPHLLDLVLVLEHLARGLPREGRWAGGAILLTVALPAPHLIGHDGLRLYLGPAIDEPGLRGVSARELLGRLAGVTPVIDLTAPLVRFDVGGAGPLVDRLHRLRAGEAAQVHAMLDDAADHLVRWRARLDERARALAEAPAWQRCPICNPITDAFPFWRGTSPEGAPQVAERYLAIVDGPESADQSDRGACTKQCPWCATRYAWRSGYEYLVNGASETETSLTRIG